MLNRLLIVFCALGVFVTGASAAEDKTAVELGQKISAMMPGQQLPDEVTMTPIEGLYQIRYGSQVFYVTSDARYLMQGKLIDLQARRDLTEEAKIGARKAIMDTVKEDQTLVYSPKKPKHTITVFTDIDCPYCRKIHQEVDQFNALGIKVRYMLYPRAGMGSPSYNKSVSVWCAKDRNTALTTAKNGGTVESKTCENPVAAHMLIGEQIGVTGTPAIVLEGGELIPGYRPAAELARVLDQLAASETAGK